ncbi:MAG: NUDIX domain-containing protein [Bacteroidota bacterium]
MTDDKFYEDLPKKALGAGALFFNESDELLIVKPTYREYWSIPGGVVDKNESPRQSCLREVKEEINLDIPIGRLLCVDYISNQDGKPENLQFVFYGGVLSPDQIKNIQVPQEELSEFKFFKVDNALLLFSAKSRRRFLHCLEALKSDIVVYLENGERIA